jgi:hypothetical protein
MTKTLKLYRLMILAGITSLFTGCAALTIDVDVYKGPLANHEDVLIEQTAVMAIGAKPLLLELRDTLETNTLGGEFTDFNLCFNNDKYSSVKDKNTVLPKDRRKTYWNLQDREAKYINTTKAGYTFCNADAGRVNSILFLYEDSKNTSNLVQKIPASLRVKEGRKFLQKFEESEAVYQPGLKNQKTYQGEWNTFKEDFYEGLADFAETVTVKDWESLNESQLNELSFNVQSLKHPLKEISKNEDYQKKLSRFLAIVTHEFQEIYTGDTEDKFALGNMIWFFEL